MAHILCIETATKVCSVCMSNDGQAECLVEDATEKLNHAEKLHLFMAEVQNQSGVDFQDLDAIAVSKGPGSYTGLRIGVSAAKGLAYALDIPIIGVNTLQSMAAQIADVPHGALLIPMIDARRMEVYAAGFCTRGENVFQTRAEIISERSFPEARNFAKVYFFGDGAAKTRSVMELRGFQMIKNLKTTSTSMALLAEKSYQRSNFEDTAYFEPFYLKDFVAGGGRLAR